MAFDESAFINCVLVPSFTADEAALSYLASSGHGGPRFEHDLVAPSSMQVGGAQLTGIPLDVSPLASKIGMALAGFEMPEVAAINGVSTNVAAALQPQTGSSDKPGSYKGTWMVEEDSLLKDMVMQYGERSWSMIAESLPGRIGKQCRERWINHLHPDIKQNDIWTEDDDKMLIGAHRHFGNRWSAIAKFLSGRSENAVKNHWNATKRSLKSKRRLKKKKSEQVAPGQLTLLEEYIRTVDPASEFTALPAAASPPPQSLAYSGLLDLGDVHTPAPEMEMDFNAASPAESPSSHLAGTIDPNMPQLPDLNISCDSQESHYMSYPMCAPAPAPPLQLVTEDPQQACFNWFPYADYLTALNADLAPGQSYYAGGSYSNAGGNGYYYSEAGPSNAGADGYYSEAGPSNAGTNSYYSEAGPSNAGGSGGEPAGYTNDVVEMASREFLPLSNDEFDWFK